MTHVGLILLAAGGSRRLGTPKQLLPDADGRTLVRRAAETALASACRPVVVVLGASAEAARAETAELPVTTVSNADWQTGLASSLRTGLHALLQGEPLEGPLDAAVVMLCDQPQVSPALLNALLAAYDSTGHQIVACEYSSNLGVPALFGQSLFPALLMLSGDEGARRVIKNYDGPIARIPFPEGALDIDTPLDVERLGRHSQAPENKTSS